MTAVLPILDALMGGEEALQQDQGAGRFVMWTLRTLGLDPSLGVLLGFIVVGITLKSIVLFLAQRYVGYTVARLATDLREMAHWLGLNTVRVGRRGDLSRRLRDELA